MLTIVTGAPGSGKTTYVQRHAKPGDIIIDFDLMAEAFGSPVGHGHNASITDVTIAAWHAAVNQAVHCHRLGSRVWIVDMRPPKTRRQMYHIAGANILEIASGTRQAT